MTNEQIDLDKTQEFKLPSEETVEVENNQEMVDQVEQLMASMVGKDTSIEGVTVEEVVNGVFRAEVKLSDGSTKVIVVEKPY